MQHSYNGEGDARYLPGFVALVTVLTLLLAMACGGGDDGEVAAPTTTPPVAAAAPTTPPVAAAAPTTPPVAAAAPTTPPAVAPAAPAAAQPSPVAAVAGGDAAGTEVSEGCSRGNEAGVGYGQPADVRLCIAENLRKIVDLYIAGVNTYDVNALLPLFEAGYWAKQESAIRQQLDELKAAGAQLTWTENQLPAQTGPTSMALLVTVEGGPSGTAQWQFGFIEVGEKDKGDWFINFLSAK